MGDECIDLETTFYRLKKGVFQSKSCTFKLVAYIGEGNCLSTKIIDKLDVDLISWIPKSRGGTSSDYNDV